MKKNNKGFVLLETLMVSTFIITVLIYLYIQFSSVEKSYYASFKYDTIQSLYSLKEVDKFINDKFGYNDFKTAVDQNENRYIELYKDNKCSVTVFPGEYSYCEKLMENLNIKTLLFVSNDISYLKIRLKTNNPYSNNLYLYLKNVDPNIANNSYILLAEFKDNTYAMLKVAEKAPKCKRATKLHTEICNRDDSYGCIAAGYSKGDKITYGNLGTKGTLVAGDAFDCDVNGDGKYNSENERFYYVSDYFDTETKEFNDKYAVLLYYNNVKNGEINRTATSPYFTEKYGPNGPTIAKQQLPTNSQWKNVSLLKTKRNLLFWNDNVSSDGVSANNPFDYEGYAARFITMQEIKSIVGNSNSNGIFDNYTFLMENTAFTHSDTPWAYWIESLRKLDYGTEGSVVWSGSRRFSSDEENKQCSVRPAIEVHKDDIEY